MFSQIAVKLFKEEVELVVLYDQVKGRYSIGFVLACGLIGRESLFDWRTKEEAVKQLQNGFVVDATFLEQVEGSRRTTNHQLVLA